MPLNADDPRAVTLPFNGLDDAVWSVRRDAQVPAGPINGLMVAGVNDGVLGAAQGGQTASGDECYLVLEIAGVGGRGEVGVAMQQSAWKIGRYVLNKRATEKDVQGLASVTNSKHWLCGSEGMLQDGRVSTIAILVDFARFGVPGCGVTSGIHVGGAAGEHESVELVQLVSELRLRLLERDGHRIGPGTAKRGEIVVQLLARTGTLFLDGAPGDADAGTQVGAIRGNGHGQENRSIGERKRQPGPKLTGMNDGGRCGPDNGFQAEHRTPKEGGQGGHFFAEKLSGTCVQRHVTQLAAGARRFAVEVEMRAGNGEDFGGVGNLADQIQHGRMPGGSRGAERIAADGAEVILKLAGNRAFNGPVTGIVDARSHLVGQELAFVFEQFDGEDADVVQGFEDTAGSVFGGEACGVFEMRRGRQ